MRIFDLKAGDAAVITKMNIGGAALERLTALGIKAGRRIEVLSFSLFKSSVLISCNAVRVGLRKSLAEKIEVKYEG